MTEQNSEFRSKKSKIPYIIIAVVILVIIYLFIGEKGGVTGGAIIEEDIVKIPLDSITKNAEFLDYNGIEYFVVKSGSAIKTAFNACDVCYKSKKGYRQEGEDMICNNCGNHYAISGLGTQNLKGGGCWPGYLPSKIENDYLVIKKSDLEAGAYRF